MKNIKIFLISFLCVSFFANNFAMKKRIKKPRTLQKKIALVRALRVYVPAPPFLEEMLKELSGQDKNIKVKIEALKYLGEDYFGQKDEKALECFKKVVELSKKFEHDEKICELALEATFNIGQICSCRAREIFEQVRNKPLSFVDVLCVTNKMKVNGIEALECYEKIVKKDKDHHLEAVSLLNIVGVKDFLHKTGITDEPEKEVNKSMKIYLQKCVKKTQRILKKERERKCPNQQLINKMEDTYNKAVLGLADEKLTPKKKEQYSLFKHFDNIKSEIEKPQRPISQAMSKSWEACVRTVVRDKERIERRFTCNTCGAKGDLKKRKLKKCGRCKEVYYCSRDCQVEDWKAGHKDTCKKK